MTEFALGMLVGVLLTIVVPGGIAFIFHWLFLRPR